MSLIKPRLVATVVYFLAVFSSGAFAELGQWDDIAPGVRLKRVTFRTVTNKGVAVTVVECDPKRLRIRVLDMYSTIGSASVSSSYSLSELASKVNLVVAINGGATDSFTLPSPVGLLLSDKQVRSRLNKKAAPNSGVVCFSEYGRQPRIDWAYNFSAFDCKNAVQSAPVLLLTLNSGGPQRYTTPPFNSKAEYSRSAIAVTRQGKILLLQTEPISLADLTKQLLEKSPAELESAMCLDGSSSSGMIINSRGRSQVRFGNTSSLIASAIVMELSR